MVVVLFIVVNQDPANNRLGASIYRGHFDYPARTNLADMIPFAACTAVGLL